MFPLFHITDTAVAYFLYCCPLQNAGLLNTEDNLLACNPSFKDFTSTCWYLCRPISFISKPLETQYPLQPNRHSDIYENIYLQIYVLCHMCSFSISDLQFLGFFFSFFICIFSYFTWSRSKIYGMIIIEIILLSMNSFDTIFCLALIEKAFIASPNNFIPLNRFTDLRCSRFQGLGSQTDWK